MVYKLIKSLFFGNVGYCRGPQDLSLIIGIVAGGLEDKQRKERNTKDKRRTIIFESNNLKKKAWLSSIMSWQCLRINLEMAYSNVVTAIVRRETNKVFKTTITTATIVKMNN